VGLIENTAKFVKARSKQISADVKVIMLIYARKTKGGMNDISLQFTVRV
jgi:hypothetical protein